MTLPVRNARIKLSQGQLFWREVGQGTALVFLHGSWQDSSQWLPLIELLGTDYHCFCPDLLGFGDSDHPETHYSVALETECLAEFLDTLRLRKVFLVGDGLGGWVAANYALRHTEQVQGLILATPEGVELEGMGGRWRWERWLTGRPPIALWILKALRPLSRWLGWGDRIEGLLQTRRQLREFPTACQILFGRRSAEVRAEQLQERLEFLAMPMLVVQTEQTAVAAALCEGYAQRSPQAKLHVLETPNVFTDSPETLAQEIREFVTDCLRTA